MSHLEETITRIKKWFEEGTEQEPTKIDVFFTERCNLNCKFCNYSKTTVEIVKQEMSDTTISKLVNEICEMNIKVFGVLGGEPFLRKKILLESMKKIKQNGINGSIVTNGTLIEENDIEKIVKMEWDLIRFSIDGLEKIHDYLRGKKGAFNKVVNNIETFFKIKRKMNSNFPTIEVNFVLTNKNYKELPELIKNISSYGINFIYILPLIELTKESNTLKIDEQEISEVITTLKRAEEIGKTYGVQSNLDEIIKNKLFLHSNKMDEIILQDKKKAPACFLPWYTININSDSSVTPCAQWPKSDGIKLNNKSLKKIWFEGFEKIRECIMNKLPECCSRCCVPLVDENKKIRKFIEM